MQRRVMEWLLTRTGADGIGQKKIAKDWSGYRSGVGWEGLKWIGEDGSELEGNGYGRGVATGRDRIGLERRGGEWIGYWRGGEWTGME